MSSFPQGLSGLNASSKNLEVIGNNIANANTFGAKTSRAEFSHVYTAALGQGGTVQAGAGVRVDTVSQQFTQGNITDTGRSTDLAISGEGFFQISDGINPTMYTRNGQFKVNNSGEIVNNDGLRLMGYGVNANGQVMPGTLQALRVPTASVTPRVTSTAKLEMNLDSRSTVLNSSLRTAQANSDEAYRKMAVAEAANRTADEALQAATNAPDALIAANEKKTETAGALTKVENDPKYTALSAELKPFYPPYVAAKAADEAAAAAVAAAQEAVDQATPDAITALQNAANDAESAANNARGAYAATLPALTAAGQEAIAAFDFDDTTTYNYATSQTAYDAQGQEVTLSYYFQKGATVPNATAPEVQQTSWNVYVSANGQLLKGADGKNLRLELTFEEGGAKPVGTSAFTLDIPSSTSSTGVRTLPLSVQFDLSASTQRSLATAVTKQEQDGYAAGNVSSINVQEDGTVMALYSNGKSFTAGQVELAKFVNPQGLQPLSGNLWAGTPASGAPVRGTPGSGVVGKIQSEALEESNVDIASELVNMITAQRSYQANAQTIKTQDQVMQTLINLR